jgi:Leucine-rich repeat (LRR) protein
LEDEDNLSDELRQILQNKNIPINLKANQLRAFFNNPNNRHEIEQIRESDLKSLNLKTIPDELNLFTGLEILNLSNNKLTKLPNNFLKNMPACQRVDLSINELTELPDKFLNNGHQLRDFDIEDNNLLKDLYDLYDHPIEIIKQAYREYFF